VVLRVNCSLFGIPGDFHNLIVCTFVCTVKPFLEKNTSGQPSISEKMKCAGDKMEDGGPIFRNWG